MLAFNNLIATDIIMWYWHTLIRRDPSSNFCRLRSKTIFYSYSKQSSAYHLYKFLDLFVRWAWSLHFLETMYIVHVDNRNTWRFVGMYNFWYRVRKAQFQKGPYQKGQLYRGTERPTFGYQKGPFFISYRKGPQIGFFME